MLLYRSQWLLKLFFNFLQVKTQFIEHAFEISSFLFFIVPMTVICVLYILIGIKLRQSKLLYGKKMKTCDSQRCIKGQSRVIRMLGKWWRPSIKWLQIKHHISCCFSCCCSHIFPVLGALPCTTNNGSLWKDNEKVIQFWWSFYAAVYRVDIHFRHQVQAYDYDCLN